MKYLTLQVIARIFSESTNLWKRCPRKRPHGKTCETL